MNCSQTYDNLWKDLGFDKKCHPDLIKQIIPSDAESLSDEDLSDYKDEDFAIDDPDDGYKKDDYFYNENPYDTAAEKLRPNEIFTYPKVIGTFSLLFYVYSC